MGKEVNFSVLAPRYKQWFQGPSFEALLSRVVPELVARKFPGKAVEAVRPLVHFRLSSQLPSLRARRNRCYPVPLVSSGPIGSGNETAQIPPWMSALVSISGPGGRRLWASLPLDVSQPK